MLARHLTSAFCKISKTVFNIVNTNTTNIMQLAKEKGNGAHLLHESKAKSNEIKVLRKSAEKLATQQLKNLLAQLMCTVDM